MRIAIVVVAAVLAAACGSKSAAPATEPAPSAGEASDEDQGAEVPEGCDQFCADGCPEAGDYDLCMQDCGCGEAPCDQGCYGGCMSQDRPEEECVAECGCAE